MYYIVVILYFSVDLCVCIAIFTKFYVYSFSGTLLEIEKCNICAFKFIPISKTASVPIEQQQVGKNNFHLAVIEFLYCKCQV